MKMMDASSNTVLSEPTSETSQVTGSQQTTESESTDSNSPSCVSLDHLKSAESLKFEIRNEVPGVTSGNCRWTPISIKRPSLCDEYGVQFLKECKDVAVVNVGGLLKARVQTKSTTFLTPIAARTRACIKSKSRPSNEPP